MTKSTSSKLKSEKAKRKGKIVRLDMLVGEVMTPAMRKRGFASVEIIDRWREIVPPPYNAQSAPDELKWPRNGTSATLVLRCTAGLRVIIAHDSPKILRAINQYFGYVLVEKIVISAAPFMPRSAPVRQNQQPLNPEQKDWIEKHMAGKEDTPLNAALRKLGEGIVRKKKV